MNLAFREAVTKQSDNPSETHPGAGLIKNDWKH